MPSPSIAPPAAVDHFILAHRSAVQAALAAIIAGALLFSSSTVAGAESTPPATPDAAAEAAPSSDEQVARESYEFQPGAVCPFCAITPEFTAGRSGLHWHGHWRPVGQREYITIPVLAVAILSTQLIPPPETPTWDSPILFDDAARDALRIHSPSGRRSASAVSDAIFVIETLHPVVLDPLIVAWWVRQSPDVAWQMFVINAQAYALTLLVNDVTKRLTARTRPWVNVDDCEQNPTGPSCGSGGKYRSFYSGHAAVTATGAGLICAHHTQLSLYQNEWLDGGTCAVAVLGTAVTGAMRIASDNHWASDVLVGHLLGYVSGYLLPTLLYYKEFRLAPHDHPSQAPTFAALPLIGDDKLGLSLFGLF